MNDGQKQIDEIMDTFEFGYVQEIMEAVDWRWGCSDVAHIPEEYELRKAARKLLNDVLGGVMITGTGGFTAVNLDGDLVLFWGLEGGLV